MRPTVDRRVTVSSDDGEISFNGRQVNGLLNLQIVSASQITDYSGNLVAFDLSDMCDVFVIRMHPNTLQRFVDGGISLEFSLSADESVIFAPADITEMLDDADGDHVLIFVR